MKQLTFGMNVKRRTVKAYTRMARQVNVYIALAYGCVITSNMNISVLLIIVVKTIAMTYLPSLRTSTLTRILKRARTTEAKSIKYWKGNVSMNRAMLYSRL